MNWKKILQGIINFVSKPTNFLLLTVIFLLIFIIKPGSCNKPVYGSGEEELLKAEVIKLNDSVRAYKVRLSLVQDDRLITKDSIIKEIIKNSKISPDVVVRWKDVYLGKAREIELSDSLYLYYNNILKIQQKMAEANNEQEKLLLKQKYDNETNAFISKRIKFSDSTENRILKGDFGLNGKLNITQDKVISRPYLVLGVKKKILNFGDPTYTAIIGNKNPSIQTDSIYATKIKPKTSWEVSFGPSVLINKNGTSIGPSVSFKRGIFQANIGYKIN